VACRTARPKRELVRVVRAPDGSVTLDATGRHPGRGAYLCRDAGCFDLAGRRKALAHALGTTIPAAIETLIAAGPEGLAALPTPQPPRAAGLQPQPEHDTTSTGGPHGQE
jgi:predicted RNA-binding protein YlxR (DUF448 family)